MNLHAAKLRLKTQIVAAIVVLSNVLGNFALGLGLRQVGKLLSWSPLAYIEALFNPWVAVGVSLLIVWMLSRLALLSWADLTYVLPVTSVGYALIAVMGRLFLDEQVTLTRWAGIILIMAGVALVSWTHPATTTPHKAGVRQ
jgi:uncharacterized membrane protein